MIISNPDQLRSEKEEESYPLLTTSEKNRLWKLVLKSATIYRSPDDKITVSIFPKLPG